MLEVVRVTGAVRRPLSLSVDGLHGPSRRTIVATMECAGNDRLGMHPLPVGEAPVRLVVPGWYGMASVKWVTRIELLRAPFDGYFQRDRYVYDDAGGVSPVERMRVKSIITAPGDGSRCGRHVTVSGWAWSGNGTSAAVDVCIDGGDAWQPARLDASASAHAWTPWNVELEFPRAGRVVLRSRATDASGAVQPDAIVWNRLLGLGYGNNAIRKTVVEVE